MYRLRRVRGVLSLEILEDGKWIVFHDRRMNDDQVLDEKRRLVELGSTVSCSSNKYLIVGCGSCKVTLVDLDTFSIVPDATITVDDEYDITNLEVEMLMGVDVCEVNPVGLKHVV